MALTLLSDCLLCLRLGMWTTRRYLHRPLFSWMVCPCQNKCGLLELTDWTYREWVYLIAGVVAFISAILCLLMHESRPAQVLRAKVRIVEKDTGFDGLSLEDEHSPPTVKTVFRDNVLLPLKLWTTEPIVFLVSVMAATAYAIVYLFTEALPIVYGSAYHIDKKTTSLIFFALAAGIVPTFLPRLYDERKLKSRTAQAKRIEPEDKLFGFFVAAPVFAIGLWWFGAAVPPLAHVSPWVSIVALVPIGYGVVEFDNVLSGYLTVSLHFVSHGDDRADTFQDTYTQYSGSANASCGLLRATLAGIFPLLGRKMFSTLDSNNALFLLAAVATAFCGVAVLFGLYGKRIRQRSPFAEKTWSTSQEVG